MNDGMRLKVLLEERGLTVKEVARVADIPPITLYSIISRNSDIKLEYAVKLATALGLKTKDIMGDKNLDVYLEEYSVDYTEEVRSEFKRILKLIDLFEEDEIKNAEFKKEPHLHIIADVPLEVLKDFFYFLKYNPNIRNITQGSEGCHHEGTHNLS